ncbi:rod-binding protein [Starkeya koreensis]|uniref:Rod-binding protein n=1 Tax=Ancylobacter koreensis TaxID=266121 RepID=A0ABT0DKX1_9HYPH|nr:rod-binding protein [Ancylobacter koreensis]MCK0207931.1 rod-binding protein [Ancylobacter koreensis]
MSIKPPSDILLDVMHAADPQKAQAIAARLRQASTLASNGAPADAPANAMAFGEMLAGAAPIRPASFEPASPLGSASATTLANATALSANRNSTVSPSYRRFEAMALGGFIEQMLPKTSATLYGAGTAGQVWRSMLAERIADRIAQAGGIGIAERIATARSTREVA